MNAIELCKHLKAVIFDLDDTLYEHAQFVRGAYRDVARVFAEETGLSAAMFVSEAWPQYERHGSRDNRIFSRVLEKHGVYSRMLEAMLVAAYRAHNPSLRLYPGVMKGFQDLRANGLRIALLADGRPEVQHRKMHALGLWDAFDATVITGELGMSFAKPNPGGFNTVLKKLKLQAREAVMIGDDPLTDVAGAHGAGMPVLRVLQGEYRSEGNSSATVTFANVDEAIKWILAERRKR